MDFVNAATMQMEASEEAMVQNFMFSIKINAKMTEKFIKADLPHVFRTKEEQARLTSLYAQAAGDKKAFRLNRTDTAGNKQADGGNLLFGRDGRENLLPAGAIADLEMDGYKLIVAEIFQKEGDSGNGFLRLTYSFSGRLVKLTEPIWKLVYMLTDRFYRKCYAYYNGEALSLNPEANPVQGDIITLNFAGPIQADELKERSHLLCHLHIKDGKYLRAVPGPRG